MLVGEEVWVSDYDYRRRVVTVTLAAVEEHHWAPIRREEAWSDPGGGFDVFVKGRPVLGSGTWEVDDALPTVAKVVARLDELGIPRWWHPDFDIGFIGSRTIWPYGLMRRVAPAHFMWWTVGRFYEGLPRNWSDVVSSLPADLE